MTAHQDNEHGRIYSAPKMPEKKPGQQMFYDSLLQYFDYITPSQKAAEDIAAIRVPFKELAEWLMAVLPANPERTVCIRSLLTAKEAAVRARLFK